MAFEFNRLTSLTMNSEMLLSPRRNSLLQWLGRHSDADLPDIVWRCNSLHLFLRLYSVAALPDMVRPGPVDPAGPLLPSGRGPLSGPVVRTAPAHPAALIGRTAQPVPAVQVALAAARWLSGNRQ